MTKKKKLFMTHSGARRENFSEKNKLYILGKRKIGKETCSV